MEKIRWLHISDLHFGYNRYIVQNMREELLSHIKTIGKIDYLFITGDLRYGKEEPVSYPLETIEFINGMRDVLGLEKESIFIVPGNHDVARVDDEGSEDTNLTAIIEQEKNYYKTSDGKVKKNTLKYIYGTRIEFLKLYESICGRKEPSVHYCIETEKVNIIHLNTALFSSKDGEDGDLIIGTQLLKEMSNQINPDKPGIVLAHHPIDSLRLEEQKALEIFLKKHNAVLYLCGHKHVAFNSNIKTARQDQDLWEYVCGTNMDFDPQLEETDMDFFVGEMDCENCSGYVQAYKWSKRSEAWLVDNDFSFPQEGATDGRHYFPPSNRPHMPQKENEEDVLKLYKEYIQFECGEIQLNGLPVDMSIGQSRFPLEKLFVPLRFEIYREQGIDYLFNRPSSFVMTHDAKWALADILNRPFHISLLDDPGGGKTTLLKRLAAGCFSGNKDTSFELPTTDLFPLWIKCRDINFSSIPTILDIISDIPHRAEMDIYTDAKTIFMQTVQMNIQNGTALLLIDGLDEINTDKDRTGFIKQLNKFVHLYPAVNVIITSRIAGYYSIIKNYLENFSNYKICPFQDSDIKRLCIAWHAQIVGTTAEIQKKAEALARNIIQHPRIRALAVNPLLLTTLLLVERRVGRLPAKRSSLYSEAIQVLLETWNIEARDPIDLDEARYQLAYIAYFMMKNRLKEITRKKLVELLISARKDLTGYISGTESYTSFIDKVEKRSALLIQKGYTTTDNSGELEPVYEFQHLTFQEYLTAYAIKNKCYSDAKRDDKPGHVLEKHLSEKNMREVILLTAVLLDRWEIQDLVELIIAKIESEEISIEDSEYLRDFLIQFIGDECLIAEKTRNRIYNFCFKNSIRNHDIDGIRAIMSSKFSDEFIEFAKKCDQSKNIKTPTYYSVIRCINGDCPDPYDYYQDNRNSEERDKRLEAVSLLDAAYWVNYKEIKKKIDEVKKKILSEDFLRQAQDEDPRIQKAAFSALRIMNLLLPEDIGRYFELYIAFVNKTGDVPAIEECISLIDKVPKRSDINVRFNLSACKKVMQTIKSKEIVDPEVYKEILTYTILILFWGRESKKEVYDLLELIDIKIIKMAGNAWNNYWKVGAQFKEFLQDNIINDTSVTEEEKKLTENYIHSFDNRWELHKVIKEKQWFEMMQNILKDTNSTNFLDKFTRGRED